MTVLRNPMDPNFHACELTYSGSESV